MVERVDKVEGQMMSIHSILKKEAYLVVAYRSDELKTKILAEVDQRMIAFETRLIHCMNEDPPDHSNLPAGNQRFGGGSPRWVAKDVGSHRED